MTSGAGPGPRALAPELRHTLSWLAVAAALVTVLLGVGLAGASAPSRTDELIYAAVTDVVPLGEWAYVVDWAGEPVGAISLIVVLAGICLVTGRRRLAVLTLAAQALLGGVEDLMKAAVNRTIHGEFLSYPSGHAAGATGFALVIALLVTDVVNAGPRMRILVVIGVPAVVGIVASWAQIVLMSHYPTDTIGGFCLALALVPPLAMVIDRSADHFRRRVDRPA